MPELELPSNRQLARLPPLMVGGYALRNALRVIPIWGENYLSASNADQQREVARTFINVLERFEKLSHFDGAAHNESELSVSSDLLFFTDAAKTMKTIAKQQGITSRTYPVTQAISSAVQSVEAAFRAARPVTSSGVHENDVATLKAKRKRTAVSQAGAASSYALCAVVFIKVSDSPIRAAVHDYSILKELSDKTLVATDTGFDLSDQGPLGPAWPGGAPAWLAKLLPAWHTILELCRD